MVKRVTIATVIETAIDANPNALCFQYDAHVRAQVPDELQRAILNIYVADVVITSNPEEI